MTLRPVALAVALGISFAAPARAQDRVVVKGARLVPPILVHEEKPRYTPEALRQKIQGAVEVEAVVLADGTVGEVQINRSLDRQFGLDDEALKAAKGWRFKPATVEGKPVPSKVIIQLEFKLAGPRPGESDEEYLRNAYRAGTPGLLMPKAKSVPSPKYTADAMRAKLQGAVEVDVVVGLEGEVMWARVKTSLDKQFGLDEQAIFAASRATFEPGTLNGKPVPVWTTLTLEFRIR